MTRSLSHRYRDFGPELPGSPETPPVPVDKLEDMQLASFDAGYQAGWEDATKAQQTGAEQAAIDVAQNLQDLSFTHREAFLKLSAAMKPLMGQIIEKLLPELAHRILGAHLLTQLTELMEEHADTAFEIAVAPEREEEIQALLADMARAPFTLVSDPLLSGGQAYLRVSDSEREINLKAVVSGIGEAIEAFYDELKQEMEND